MFEDIDPYETLKAIKLLDKAAAHFGEAADSGEATYFGEQEKKRGIRIRAQVMNECPTAFAAIVAGMRAGAIPQFSTDAWDEWYVRQRQSLERGCGEFSPQGLVCGRILHHRDKHNW